MDGRAARRARVIAARVRTGASLAGALLATAALSACGVKQEAVVSSPSTKPFTVALDRPPNATHAALYAAIADGAFRAGGLSVQPRTPVSAGEALRLLDEGKADVAILRAPELLLARDRGTALVSIAALVQQPLGALIALPRARVASASELAGKRVGTDGSEAEADLLRALLAHAGVNPASVRPVAIGFAYARALLHGRVDATFGGFTTYDALSLSQMHRNPLVIPVGSAGVPAYDELVLAAPAREAEHDGEDLRAFLHALTRGQQDVKADPKVAASVLVKANPGLDARLELAAIEHTLALNYPASGNHPYGYQEPGEWESFARWMYQQRMLHTSPATLAPPFTNEFLPGQGP
jgi:putative hydroxymethylpyrimidine transport system substrate-binding protein